MICHMPRIVYIVQTPTMNPILLCSTESSSLSVNFFPEEYREKIIIKNKNLLTSSPRVHFDWLYNLIQLNYL